MGSHLLLGLLVLVLVVVCAQRSDSQSVAPAPAPDVGCNGVQLSYSLDRRDKIRPFVSDPASQPYSFHATATVLNSGTTPLKSWSLLVAFRHGEILVSASGAVLTDASDFPYNTSGDATTSFSGYPNPDLLTPIATAGDLSLIQAQIDLLPPRRAGDLTISYDVLQAYPSSYLALVTIENHNPLARLDNWRLSWEWKRQEFIYSLKGAYPLEVDATGCVYGPQGQYYQDLDFSKVLNCQRSPVVLDLPLSRYNDSQLGLIPHCCRNGTILPKSMDPSQSVSAFQMQVFKMPPDVNRTVLYPPAAWKIAGGSDLNPDYACGPAVRVAPAEFPDPSGLESNTSAIASWQVVCNISAPRGSKPKCCVSFSAFYNDSVVPCGTCACGCPAARTCNASAPPLLLPSEALLVPFDNRTAKALAWAELKHFAVPNPLPCGDNCGVSINWHLYTDYAKGWSARITLFNWESVDLPNWFAAVVMDQAYDGYETMYSFNGTRVGDHTIFMQGNEGLNYLVGETNGTDPSEDPRVPGKQQSVISFTKKPTPGINVVAGDGFPSKVYFNGDECSMPGSIPTSKGLRTIATSSIFNSVFVLGVSALLLFQV
ncbi:COBRA-like protein 7 [Ananas comosus]|uniref:COBRA-like protein 7 n=1 Tax=Ananas comosus TaxID=4615 RepID=A0A199VNQ2_ANACO|nr:COBRA-like protein 7 [Ananas comosus]